MVGFEEMRGELLERIEDLLKRTQYTAICSLTSLRRILPRFLKIWTRTAFHSSSVSFPKSPRRRCSSNSIPMRRRY